MSSPKEGPSTPVEVDSSKKEGAPTPKEVATPKEVLSPTEIGSPNKISSPKQDSVAKELFPSEKDQDKNEEPLAPCVPLPTEEVSSPTESKTGEKIATPETDIKETVPSPARQKQAEIEPSEKPGPTVKLRAERPAAPKRGNVRANMALFEPNSVASVKPAVSDSSSAPRAMKRWSQAGSQRPSFEDGTPPPTQAPAKPEEKAVNSNVQDSEPKRPIYKKPVSSPKQRKAPVNTEEKPDSKDDDSPEPKPLSIKERMSKFQVKSNVRSAPKPWKPRTTSTASKEDSNKQKEANKPVPSENQVIMQVADKADKSEPASIKPADSQKESPAVDSSQGEKSNEVEVVGREEDGESSFRSIMRKFQHQPIHAK
jgi:hypothetical protein